MKNRAVSIIFFFFIVFMVFGLWRWSNQLNAKFYAPERQNITQTETIQVKIKFDNTRVTSLQYPYQNKQSLLEITKNIAHQQNWTFTSEDYADLGILVTQIADKKNGQDQKYWQYQINGQTPLISADRYLPQAGDLLEWNFKNSEQ